jgi:hypothetical protein
MKESKKNTREALKGFLAFCRQRRASVARSCSVMFVFSFLSSFLYIHPPKFRKIYLDQYSIFCCSSVLKMHLGMTCSQSVTAVWHWRGSCVL